MRNARSNLIVATCFLLCAAVMPSVGQVTTAAAPADGPAAPRTAQELRHAKVAALIADARKLYDANQLKEAADLLRQATLIDPQDENAAFTLRLITEELGARNAAESRVAGDLEHGTIKLLPRLTVDGGIYEGSSHTDSPQDRAARGKLEETLKEITAENQSLEKVLNFLRDNMGANIFVNWTALGGLHIDRNTPVTVSLKDVAFGKALDAILAKAGGGKLTYTIDDGIITISTKDDLMSAKYQIIRVYDVRDLIVLLGRNLPALPESKIDLTLPATPADQGPLQGANGLFSDMPGEAAMTERRAQIVKQIMTQVTKAVAPDTWRDGGGTIGSIRELNGQLIVNQTVENQIAVFKFLNQLRNQQVAHVTLESRMLLVPAGVLDDFHFAWSVQSVPLAAMPDFKPDGDLFGVGYDRSAGFPGNTAATHPMEPTAAPVDGKFTAAIIDPRALPKFLQATQADPRVSTLTAPRSTLADGTPATVAWALPVRYMAGYAQVLRTGTMQWAPAYQTVDTGFWAKMQPIVSPDGQSLTAHIDVMQRTLAHIDHAPATEPPAESNLQIEKPVIDTAGGTFQIPLRTTGTLLLDLGAAPADFPPTAAQPAEPRRLLLLLRMTIIPRPKDAAPASPPTTTPLP